MEKKYIKKFANDKNYRKVRDHCHCAGKYRRTAHSICNLKIMCLMKSLPFFTTVQILIIILSLKN